jgi:hypothetical protein
MEYNKTRDILHVMKILGHKIIQNTLLYAAYQLPRRGRIYFKIASTVEEAKQLIEVGFDYVCDVDSAKLFRKRK